jgi:CheY-like chemotaxis protein
MALEVLRAKLQAAGNLKSELTATATAARTTAGEMDDLSDETASAGVSAAVLSEGLDDAGGEAAQLAAQEALAAEQTEKLGDELLQTAAQAGVLGEALDDAGDDLSGFNGRLSRVAALTAVATPAVLGLGAALGGLGAAGGALGAGIIGISAAGIEARAEETAALNDELETVADAREQILGDFRTRLGDAFEPLQNAASEEFAFANLAAIVEVAENAADSLLRLQETVINVGGAFRDTIVDVSGETFTALATEAERLAPLLLQLQGAIRDIPGLIRFLGDAAARIGPDLFTLADNLGRITAGLTEFGIGALELVLPPLNGFLELIATAADTFRGLPESLQLGITAFVGLTAAVAAFSAAATLAAGAVTVLTAPISLSVLAIAAFTAAVVVALEEVGLLDDVLRAIANPIQTAESGFRNLENAIDGVQQSVADFILDISVVNRLLDILNIRASEAEQAIESLTGGFLAGAFGLSPTEALALTTDAGEEESETGGEEAATTQPGATQPQQPDMSVDASGEEGSLIFTPPTQQSSSDMNQTIDITIQGDSANPAATRKAVRRGVEEANRRRRNIEGGRID